MTVVLHLPWPPSVNSANGFGKKGYYPSAEKKQFFAAADALFLTQKRTIGRIEGPFTYHIVLNRKMRGALDDGDNRLKYPLDCAQRFGLIANDKLAEGGSWSWGTCEFGAMLSIHPVQDASMHPCKAALTDPHVTGQPVKARHNIPVSVASASSPTAGEASHDRDRTQRTTESVG